MPINLTPVLEVDNQPEFVALPSTIRILCKQSESEIASLSEMMQSLLDRGAERGKHFVLLSATHGVDGAPPGLLLCASDNWLSPEDIP